ncbi:MAG: hypothetical protein N3G18_04500, partial [Candidatus Saccharicenans sp.]|nr:hypothetical protein [Candidatus Saccharicenans sp.]
NALQIKNMLTGEKLQVPATLLEKYPVLKEIARKLEKGQIDLFEEKLGEEKPDLEKTTVEKGKDSK